MANSDKKRYSDKKILFSIGAKLVIIVTFIVVLSLGSITVLVSWLVRQDLQISAEESNFEANRRSALEAEDTFIKIRSDTMIITRLLTSAGTDSSLGKETLVFFFEQNPRIAALYFSAPSNEGGQEHKLLVNERVVRSHGIDDLFAQKYIDNNQMALRRAALGETLILNAAPHFSANLLAMFFPGRAGSAQMVLFSPDNLNTSFGSGLNHSFLLNNAGDVLIHADYDLIRTGLNISDRSFIREIQESTNKNRQSLIETDFGISSGVSGGKDLFRGFSDSFGKAKSAVIPALSGVKQFCIKLYDKCADPICKLLKIDRKTPVMRNAGAKTHDAGAASGGSAPVLQFVAFTKLNVGGCIVITSIEHDKVFEGIEATTRRNIYLTIAVLLFSVMLIWFFAKSISVPLKLLAAAARSVEGGDFELQLTPRGRDEIGLLTSSFQKMCSALRIFGRFTNKEIALQAMRGQIKPGGLPKHATVFFSDIREFTAKSEQFTNIFRSEASNHIVHWLNDYFTRMIECVEKTGGIIDKFIGDAVMAHWGTAYTAGSPEKDAFNCVKAALLMRKALYMMNKDRQFGDPANPPIRIGCGINTGIVTAGQLGSDMRMEYTVIGDPVNLASRIEALTKPMGADILISEDTHNLIGNRFTTEEMPSVTVKGKEKPVRIFAVVNFAGKNNKPRTLKEVRGLLGIEEPDFEKIDVNADEKKYKIGEADKNTEDKIGNG